MTQGTQDLSHCATLVFKDAPHLSTVMPRQIHCALGHSEPINHHLNKIRRFKQCFEIGMAKLLHIKDLFLWYSGGEGRGEEGSSGDGDDSKSL